MGARGARSGTRRGCARRIGGSMARANTSRPYDVEADRLMMRCYRRKRYREVLLFLTHIRSRYPVATRLYLVLDNFSPHKRREVTDWAADHNVELVFTPTYASWLNRIEAIFSGVRYFALANSDYPDHEHSRRAILAYVAWRNRHRHTELVKRREKHKDAFRYEALVQLSA